MLGDFVVVVVAGLGDFKVGSPRQGTGVRETW